MTVLERARRGEVPALVEEAARAEGADPRQLAGAVARGEAAVCVNRGRGACRPAAVGRGLRVKVNANLGTSSDCADPEQELAKLRAALDAGADAVMDLSTAGDLSAMRARILEACPVPLGTVPVYEAAVRALKRGASSPVDMAAADLLAAVEAHAREGVAFMTVHCGITRAGLRRIDRGQRLLGIVSRGGSLLAGWMRRTGAENPLYERFDEVLAICRAEDVVLSLGDGLRPGALADATDAAQLEELSVLGELTERAWAAGVQVIVEGPGHVPLHEVAANVALQKRLCKGAPFYVLGPLVTDVAPGYDHITSAIGGALAAQAGADMLCYVTPSEHLGLPTADDVRAGVIASRIAAHAADVARGLPGARDWDDAMARARAALDWEGQMRLALDPAEARRIRERALPADAEVCTMCGELCAYRQERDSRRECAGAGPAGA